MAEAKQPSELKPEDLLRTVKRWWELDRSHSAAWRKQAKEEYDFVANEQWSAEDKEYLRSQGRVPITFNRTSTLIKAVCGIEINGRHETTFLPRGTAPGVVQKNELLSGASKWMDDESDAPTAQSRAFSDVVKVGMGWTEASLSYEDDPDGSYVERRINPLEMWWDKAAREPNLADAKRVWHVRTDIDIEEARSMFPDVDDEDLDATWCDPLSADDAVKSKEQKRNRTDENAVEYDGRTVTIARLQWVEKEPYYMAAIPGQNGQMVKQEVRKDQLKALNDVLKKQGMPPLRAVQMTRKVYKQAFVGARILNEENLDMPCPHFSFNCITGEPHENKGTFYGITTLVRDPQMWANKWLSQVLHIINTNANNGMMVEEGVWKDQQDIEMNWSRPGHMAVARKGTLTEGKVQPKPQAPFPAGFMELTSFATTAIRDASGINLEILGLREATQPGVLEAQRKQAGMTILATLFDALQGFRKRVGKVRLYYLQTYLADGRLIRLAGPSGEQYVPLVQDKVAGRYDIIVSDAPTSPNMKEQTWQQLQPLLAMFKDQISPELMLQLMEYSPLPSAVVEKIKNAVQEQQTQQQQDPETQAKKQLAMRGEVAKITKTEAETAKIKADTNSVQVKSAVEVADAEHTRMMPRQRPQRVPAAVPS